MKQLILALAITLFLTVPAYALDLTISYGKDTWIESWCSKDVKTRAFELELKTPYNKWLDIGIAAHTVWSDTVPGHIIDDVYFGGTDLNLIIVGRLIIRRMLSERVFIEGFGGLGLVTLDSPPEIGDKPYVGNFGMSIGYKFDKWSILYRADHYSVPLYKGDKGHNRHYIGVRVPFGK